jgi:photosystem II stability/assembly factor-like uncharacterized protein
MWHAALALLAAPALMLLAGCGSDYGGTPNHMHDLLVLRGMPSTLLVASHIGLYRSTDAGKNWSEVAGENGQAADGLMLFKLAQSPVDFKRVYVLAIPRPDNPGAAKGKPGIYTSADAGATWKLATATTTFPASIYTIATGAASSGQVFALLSGDQGLYTSGDAGAHWQRLPSLPAGNVAGILGDPAHAGRLLLYSLSSGLFQSDDNGHSWSQTQGIAGGVSALCVAGSDAAYAIGDQGVYVSHDDAHSFALVNKDETFSSVSASLADAKLAYALTNAAVYATRDGGVTWKQAAPIDRHPANLAVDPANAAQAYVSMSNPIGVVQTKDSGAHWQQILP